ncbi:quinone oxidoreductase family protein [Kribbella jiaozuonensis]|uniref:Zinc-binding alcohol dehydrogenase family protein n=1 Tax=Kribbella jiaozuonensis TaxID=2575441 RepID=A0A4U3LZW3_9ACTN|nr:zinc-binding alcohol dehydrogenase family protein [Kribbella jiaozuonensis]TKK80377.1 zinc-binding alcohol dehydrogenase family protein [Kribbella jiaozuonensis]
MYAAVVRSFDEPPTYDVFPEPTGSDVLEVVAAGLHPRVRSAANGTHYTSEGSLPMVPGIDGVARTAEGELLYFVADDNTTGTMAERAAVDRRRAVVLPEGTDPVAVAAGMNPAMSSWIALRRRAKFQGGSVLVLGATGNAGQLAVQIVKHLGASNVIGVGRDPERLKLLPSLGADEAVGLDAVGAVAADVGVVLDYLWGEPTEQAMSAILHARSDRALPLTWIQIGSMAARELTLPSYLLRAAALTVIGSGQGSVSGRDILAELPQLAALITSGELAINARPVPLAEVGKAWAEPAAPGERVVLVP